MSLKYLVVALALPISCLAAPEAVTAAKGRRYQHYEITGVHTGINPTTGARPARRNILDMQKDIPAWSLYVQALTAMQNDSESDLTSYYQIAGIHGRPYASWDNVPQANGAPLTGYCTHDSVLFPTWHRPYLAIFEQILASHAQSIAKTYTLLPYKVQYQAAADSFRIPYWDWASTPQMPSFVNTPTVQITTPSGVQNVPNPLLQYKFQQFPLNPIYFPSKSSQAYDYYLANYRMTVRSPDSIGAGSNFNYANSVLANDNLRSRTYYALTKSPTYNNFATQIIWGPSIEGVHGSVHVDVGGNYGHMSQLSYSGFDPIFWLHHTNVDRLIALYQAMYPASQNTSYYLQPFPEYIGTYTIAVNSIDSLTTPLEPFSTNAQGNFYTSQSSQYLSAFGYTYPEIHDWNQNVQQLASNITAQVNILYGPPPPVPSPAIASASTSMPASPSSNPMNVTVAKRGSTLESTKRIQVIEWSVSISVSKFELDGHRFLVRLFLDGVPENPKEWPISSACVGSFAVLPPPQRGFGPLPDIRAFDEISLVVGLRNVGHNGQDAQAVVEYLKEGFEWRVQRMDGTVVPTEQLTSLTIMVQEEVVTLGRDIYEVPTYGEKTFHPEITEGKAGGYAKK